MYTRLAWSAACNHSHHHHHHHHHIRIANCTRHETCAQPTQRIHFLFQARLVSPNKDRTIWVLCISQGVCRHTTIFHMLCAATTQYRFQAKALLDAMIAELEGTANRIKVLSVRDARQRYNQNWQTPAKGALQSCLRWKQLCKVRMLVHLLSHKLHCISSKLRATAACCTVAVHTNIGIGRGCPQPYEAEKTENNNFCKAAARPLPTQRE